MLKKILTFMTIAVAMMVLVACNGTTSGTTTTGNNITTTSNSTTSTNGSNTSDITASTTITNPSTTQPPTTVITTEPTTSDTETTTSNESGLFGISYQGSTLVSGTVGVAYSANIATATGASGIYYSLKSGSELPNGLALVGGTISGTPTTAGTTQVVIIADAVNSIAPVEATFSIEIEVEITGPQTYIFEAEYVDLTDVWGSGWSNTQTEWGMVMGDGETTPTSNGFYVAYFVPPAGILKFPFTSNAAGTGKLSFSMVSEYAKEFYGVGLAMLLQPSIMTFKINGVEITDYSVLIRAENNPTMDFDEYVFMEEFDILEGENIIEISMSEPNDYFPNRTGGGPNVDYMKIESELNLVMDTYISTPEEVIMLRGN
jgi:hypothetical protein